MKILLDKMGLDSVGMHRFSTLNVVGSHLQVTVSQSVSQILMSLQKKEAGPALDL